MAEEVFQRGGCQGRNFREVGEEKRSRLWRHGGGHQGRARSSSQNEVQEFPADPVREVRAVRLVVRVRFARAEEGRDVLSQGNLEEKVGRFLFPLRLREKTAEGQQVGADRVRV